MLGLSVNFVTLKEVPKQCIGFVVLVLDAYAVLDVLAKEL
jgi:hypothetical protein